MSILRVLLFPFSILYGLVMRLRNHLYDSGLKPSAGFDIPLICVGNLSVGGTGKTPMVEYLVRLLGDNYKLATLSRGYGRRTKGVRITDASDSALTVGDEPFQFYRKFGEFVAVAVAEDRAYAVPHILDRRYGTEVIILDDAFQHRRIRASLNILLTDYNKPFFEDFILPAGRLRESRQGVSRADVIIVTKCPHNISDEKMMEMEKVIRSYAEKPVFFTRVKYGTPRSFQGHNQSDNTKVILVSGIANARMLEEYVAKNYTLVKHLRYSDHHHYTERNINSLTTLYADNPDTIILTTEKDMVKIDTEEFRWKINKLPLFYLPIETEFIKNGKDFDVIVTSTIQRETEKKSS
jgi:tetraacyldisaccharide 4'-kinase